MKTLFHFILFFPVILFAQQNTIISGFGGGSGDPGAEIICGETDTFDYLKSYSSEGDCWGSVHYSSGTYTPTLTNRFGITSSTAGTFTYVRLGNVLTLSGSIALTDSSSSAVQWILKLSLPVSSNFTLIDDAVGTGTVATNTSPYVTATAPVILFAQPSTDLIYVTGTTNTNSSQYVNVTCTYKIK